MAEDARDLVDLVVAGFEPFGGRGENRSWQVVEALPSLPADVTCERAQLPVDFAALRTLVPALVARARHAVLLLGEAGGTDALQVERVALNVADARIADNRGAQPRLEALDAASDAPLARLSRWDAAAVSAVLTAAGLPVRISHHAGTYACNAALYLALAAAAASPSAPAVVGFVHVPVDAALETPRIAAGIARLLLTFRGRRDTSSQTGFR